SDRGHFVISVLQDSSLVYGERLWTSARLRCPWLADMLINLISSYRTHPKYDANYNELRFRRT
ncbi:MAG: hypothetical protein WA398_03505, partial [Nitrososphaeraceae archaeon]